MKLNDKFANVFYKTEFDVLKITRGTGYDRSEKTEKLCTLKGDLQPYGGELARTEHGLSIECSMRLFCAENENIKAGNHIEANGLRYRIEYAENRSLGMTAFLKGVQTDD